MDKIITIVVSVKSRIDKIINLESPNSRNRTKTLIENGCIQLNKKIVTKPSTIAKEGDEILINDTLVEIVDIKPENIPLDVIYEDNDVIVINKKSGLVVHPGAGNWSGTLVNALMHRYEGKLSDHGGIERPGIVHRLDKDTSGLMIIAKNNITHNYLNDQLKNHKIIRKYVAITEGKIPNKKMHIKLPIGRSSKDRKKMEVTRIHSREAITHVHELDSWVNNSLVECQLETGRTHQIRVHLAYIGTPVLNDPTYGKSTNDFNQYLCAWKLEFELPNGEQKSFKLDLPQEFRDKWKEITSREPVLLS